MTRQTTTPLPQYGLSTAHRLACELARMVDNGKIDMAPPYQRGEVWTVDQQRALVMSWVMGIPIPAIMLNRPVDGVAWAVVDGKQRLTAAHTWFFGTLTVPSAWFPAEQVTDPTATEVAFAGLTTQAQDRFEDRAALPVVQAQLPTVQAEAELFLLVNGGGTAHTELDMARAEGYTH